MQGSDDFKNWRQTHNPEGGRLDFVDLALRVAILAALCFLLSTFVAKPLLLATLANLLILAALTTFLWAGVLGELPRRDCFGSYDVSICLLLLALLAGLFVDHQAVDAYLQTAQGDLPEGQGV